MSLQYDPKTGRLVDPLQRGVDAAIPYTAPPSLNYSGPQITLPNLGYGAVTPVNSGAINQPFLPASVVPPAIQPNGLTPPVSNSGYTRDAQGNVFNAQGSPVSYASLPKGPDGRPLMNLTTLPMKAPVVPVIPTKFTAPNLEQTVGSTVADTQAKYDAKIAAIEKGYADQIAGMMPTEGEIARRDRLTNLQEAQTRSIEDVQNRSLSGATLTGASESEISNIQQGKTFASMPNIREQRLLTLQLGNDLATRQIKVDQAKVAIDAGQADYNMFRDYQKTVLDFETKVQERNDQLPVRQKQYIDSIVTQYGGLEWNDLDPQTKSTLTDIATKLGISVQAIQTNLKNEKNKIQLDEANTRSQIANRNESSSGTAESTKRDTAFEKYVNDLVSEIFKGTYSREVAKQMLKTLYPDYDENVIYDLIPDSVEKQLNKK